MAHTNITLPDGIPVLNSLYIYAAGSCNLACRHCWITPGYLPNGSTGGSYVKLEHVQKAICEGKSLGLNTVKLTGGEPTLHPQFRELVQLIEKAELSLVIETNGTLIDKSLAQFLTTSTHGIFISVSLDGATEKTHDSLRSVHGSFDLAVAGIRNLVEVGYRPQIICTLHRGNVSELADVVRLAEQLGCSSVKLNHVQQVGRGGNFGVENGLHLPEIIQLYKTIEAELVPTTRLPIYFDIPIAFRPLPELLHHSLNRCTIRNIIGMLSTGEYALCGIGTSVLELIYGNAEVDDLKDIWCTHSGLSKLRDQVPSQLEGICAECIHRDFCQGACVANNFHVAGKLNAAYYFCDIANQQGLFPISRKRDYKPQGEKHEQ